MKHIIPYYEAIKISKDIKKKSKKTDPYYILVYRYMIGDSNGYTNEKVKISADNPFLERYCKILNSLTPPSGHWGVDLDYEGINKQLSQNLITEDDYYFLMRTLFQDYHDEDENIEKYFTSEKDNKYADEFYKGVRSENVYSFLVFEGVDIYYVDKNGKKNKAEIENTLDKSLLDFKGEKYEKLSILESKKITDDLRVNPSISDLNEIEKIFSPIFTKDDNGFQFEKKDKNIYIFTKFENIINIFKLDDKLWIIHIPLLNSGVVNWAHYKCSGLKGVEYFYKNEIFKILNNSKNRKRFPEFKWI